MLLSQSGENDENDDDDDDGDMSLAEQASDRPISASGVHHRNVVPSTNKDDDDDILVA